MISVPFFRGVAAVTGAQIAALLLPGLVAAWEGGQAFLTVLSVAMLSALIWEAVFSRLRSYPISFHGATTALIVAILLPVDFAIWQTILIISLGTVLGELVFGGRGFGFLSPSVVALTLTLVSFPQAQLNAPSNLLTIATFPGAVLLLGLGFIPWRVFLSCLLVVTLAAASSSQELAPAAIVGSLVFGLTFLICDPVSASATGAGQWIYGVMSGGLILLFAPGGVIAQEAMVFAALLASVFVPLIDHCVALAKAWLRKRRHV